MTARLLTVAAMLCLQWSALAALAQTPGAAREAYRTASHASRAPVMAAARAGERIVTAGDFGTVLLSDDAGASWRQAASVPTRATLTSVAFADARQGWAVGHGGVVLGTRDGGERWTRLADLGKDVVPFSLRFSDAQHGLAVGAFGFAAATEDGGRTWKRQAISQDEYGDRHLYSIFAGPEGVLWIAAEGGVVFRSDDAGRSFHAVTLPYKGSIWSGTVLRDGAVLAWGMGGRVLRSGDGGRSWIEVPSGTQQALTAGVQLAGGEIVIAGLAGAVIRSRDGGRTFVAQTRPERQSHTALIEAGGALHTFTLAGIGGSIK